uniref:DNA translocase FtsK n=1 Tax=Ndongobacter massiliensis TaxID=1871025 RepID=UPI000A53B11B|nr:DNA translocase FtsK [Ndongobacter massiliensis]
MAQKMSKRRTPSKTVRQQRNRQVAAAIGVALFLLVSIAIYFQPHTGVLGRTVGGFFYRLFGAGAPAVPPLFLLLYVPAIYDKFHGKLAGTLLYLGTLFFCFLLIVGVHQLPGGTLQTSLDMGAERGATHSGAGFFGALFSFFLSKAIGKIGIYVLSALILLLFVLHLFSIPLTAFLTKFVQGVVALLGALRDGLFHVGKRGARRVQKAHQRHQERAQQRREMRSTRALEEESPPTDTVAEAAAEAPSKEATMVRINNYAEELQTESKAAPRVPEEAPSAAPREPAEVLKRPVPPKQMDVESLGLEMEEEPALYTPPPLELLRLPKGAGATDEAVLRKNAQIIEKTLSSFGIESQVVSIDRGPTVTCFELKPQSGVKVSRIVNLADDLSLALAAADIRIEAPIPGKPYVGVEVPNREKDDVLLREILQTDAFQKSKDVLPMALGKSISGQPQIASIAKMPHLLIAGATGSGKSVCINTIIMSILYRYTPQDVRLILIDPKVVELSVYSDIPHLLIPVVTDPKKASRALYMAVQEMERRFKLFSQFAVRDIKGYREKQALDEDMENLPYVVVIVDELSDLMMVASKDVEAHITRLAQMARACGIHLIIATQRPSVDVITGTIKANIPSRISFQVSSSIDSRTILDMAGAEKLLGKGDMLYYPANFSKPKRLQGAFVSDREVANIVAYIKEKHTVQYDADLALSVDKGGKEADLTADGPQDELLEEVIDFIKHEKTTSISGLQRRFRIGYSRAGRIVDELEAMGAVGPQDGSKPRPVLIYEGDVDEYSE